MRVEELVQSRHRLATEGRSGACLATCLRMNRIRAWQAAVWYSPTKTILCFRRIVWYSWRLRCRYDWAGSWCTSGRSRDHLPLLARQRCLRGQPKAWISFNAFESHKPGIFFCSYSDRYPHFVTIRGYECKVFFSSSTRRMSFPKSKCIEMWKL